MVKEGTPGKYTLRAVEPGSRRPLMESCATSDEVAARRAKLERAGYTVIVTVDETVRRDGSAPLATASPAGEDGAALARGPA